ncbi:MAG: hypothetical protein JXA78_05270 [Anaerolineales bacterium]|nr:hypothetical protein [Anaerolineales bacterium]
MTLPALILGFLISTLYGAVFHVWRGGGAGRLLLYLFLGWTGFWAGHLLAIYMSWSLFNVGPLRLGGATIGSLVFLGIGHWLSLVETEPKKRKQ